MYETLIQGWRMYAPVLEVTYGNYVTTRKKLKFDYHNIDKIHFIFSIINKILFNIYKLTQKKIIFYELTHFRIFFTVYAAMQHF